MSLPQNDLIFVRDIYQIIPQQSTRWKEASGLGFIVMNVTVGVAR